MKGILLALLLLQRVVWTPANHLAFDFDPAMGLKVGTDADAYTGILTIDVQAYPITVWQFCQPLTNTVTCEFLVPQAGIDLLNVVGKHTIKLKLMSVADPTNISGDSAPLIWDSKAPAIAPPTGLRIQSQVP